MNDLAAGVSVLRKVLVRPDHSKSGGDGAKEGSDRFDQDLASILERFQLVSKLDELWNADVASGKLAYNDGDEEEISGYYRDWLAAAEQVAVELKARQTSDLTFPQAEEFLICLQNARGVCTPDEVFFSGPAFEALEARAIAASLAGETVEFQELGD